MQSKHFPWLSRLEERDAYDFILRLGSALRPDYDEEGESPSWEEVMAHVDEVIATYQKMAERTSEEATEKTEAFPPVQMELSGESQIVFFYRVETDHLIKSPGKTVRPKKLVITMSPDTEGYWCADVVQVEGHLVVNGEVQSRSRLTSMYFSDPLDDPDSVPTWLLEIVRHHVNRMNPDDLRERQDEAARNKAREMFAGLMPGDLGITMADEIADKIVAAVRRVG